MPNIVIVAGGLGSRLAPLTDHIPKFLINIGKQTGYVEQVRYWQQYTDFGAEYRKDYEENKDLWKDVEPYFGSLTVIVHSNYEQLVRAYHELYFPTIPLIIRTVDVANGSAHAILTSCDHLIGKSVFFQWCDIIPVDLLPIEEMTEYFHGANVVFTNYNNSNRYGLVRTGSGWADVRPELDPDERGGCFGLYYISHYTNQVEFKPGQDFIEVIHKFGKIREFKVDRIIDFGDKPKLNRTRLKADEAREFNSIEFQGDFVIKKALNEQGKAIISKEIGWYKEVGRLDTQNKLSIPKTWISTSDDSLIMSKVDGTPVWKAWPLLSPVDRHFVLSQIIEQRKTMFNLYSEPAPSMLWWPDVQREAKDKLLSRYAEIQPLIDSFGRITHVNDQSVKTLRQQLSVEETILALFEQLVNHYNNGSHEYGVIHGDLQMSNSMVNLETLKVSMIDPRGYFGMSSIYGFEDYDAAKLLYSLTGYDLFNYSQDFHIKIDRGHLTFKLEQPSHEGVEEIVKSEMTRVRKLWLAVIWLGLGQYIKNDPVKSLAAHYHGLNMANLVLSSKY